jgi:CBS domain-containing protein
MRVSFFLTPKAEVVTLDADSTMRQAMEKMERHRYAAIPLLDEGGHYVGTLTEGDLLWRLKRELGTWREVAEATPVLAIERRVQHRTVHIDDEMEALVTLAIDQNFVPVVDDRDVFVGIVRRRTILEYCLARIAVVTG